MRALLLASFIVFAWSLCSDHKATIYSNSDCDGCLSDAQGCGWCLANGGSCVPGTASGPSGAGASCTPTGYAWRFSVTNGGTGCLPPDCGQISDCGDCVANPTCGWCQPPSTSGSPVAFCNAGGKTGIDTTNNASCPFSTSWFFCQCPPTPYTTPGQASAQQQNLSCPTCNPLAPVENCPWQNVGGAVPPAPSSAPAPSPPPATGPFWWNITWPINSAQIGWLEQAESIVTAILNNNAFGSYSYVTVCGGVSPCAAASGSITLAIEFSGGKPSGWPSDPTALKNTNGQTLADAFSAINLAPTSLITEATGDSPRFSIRVAVFLSALFMP